MTHFNRLRPENGIQVFGMSETERRHQMLPLKFVCIALNNDQSIAENKAQKLSKWPWLLKIVAFVDKDLCEGSGLSDDSQVGIKEAREADETLIGDFIDESSHSITSWLFPENTAMTDNWTGALDKSVSCTFTFGRRSYLGSCMIPERAEPVWVYEDIVNGPKGKVDARDENKEFGDRFSRQDLGEEEDIEYAQRCRERY